MCYYDIWNDVQRWADDGKRRWRKLNFKTEFTRTALPEIMFRSCTIIIYIKHTLLLILLLLLLLLLLLQQLREQRYRIIGLSVCVTRGYVLSVYTYRQYYGMFRK